MDNFASYCVKQPTKCQRPFLCKPEVDKCSYSVIRNLDEVGLSGLKNQIIKTHEVFDILYPLEPNSIIITVLLPRKMPMRGWWVEVQ